MLIRQEVGKYINTAIEMFGTYRKCCGGDYDFLNCAASAVLYLALCAVCSIIALESRDRNDCNFSVFYDIMSH